MKKIIISLVIGSFLLSIHPVQAKKFIENGLFTEYQYYMYEKTNPSNFASMRVIKIFDSENKVYYNISPKTSFYFSRDYEEEDLNITEQQLKNISKILYYGYGYNKQNTDEFYAATQYLVFKTFEMYTVYIKKGINEPILMFEEEIKQIEANMENKEFTFENQTTHEKTLEIEDDYIQNHFTVQGEHIKVEELESKLKLTLDGKVEDYQVEFIPKKTCSNLKMWVNDKTHLFHLDEVCETTYSRTIHYEEPIVEKEPTIESKDPEKTEEENKNPNQEEEKKEPTTEPKEPEKVEEENTSKKENVKENQPVEKQQEEVFVEVPSTGKQSMMFFLVFGLLGNCYYVFKK